MLSGGELAAMVVADAVLRKLPGALGHAESAVEESFSEALEGAPEYPHYTRPADYRGWGVPEILLSGDHERVREWRLERSRERGRAQTMLDRLAAVGERPSTISAGSRGPAQPGTRVSYEHDHREHRAARSSAGSRASTPATACASTSR